METETSAVLSTRTFCSDANVLSLLSNTVDPSHMCLLST